MCTLLSALLPMTLPQLAVAALILLPLFLIFVSDVVDDGFDSTQCSSLVLGKTWSRSAANFRSTMVVHLSCLHRLLLGVGYIIASCHYPLTLVDQRV